MDIVGIIGIIGIISNVGIVHSWVLLVVGIIIKYGST